MSTSVVFIVRCFLLRLFSYLTKSILPLLYDSFVIRLFSYLTESILPLLYDSFVIRLFSYLTKSILPLIYDSFIKRLFSFLTKSILPLFYDSFVIRLFSLFTLNNNVWYIDNSHSILILWHHVSSIHCYQCINVFNGVKKICFMGLAIYRIILDDFES